MSRPSNNAIFEYHEPEWTSYGQVWQNVNGIDRQTHREQPERINNHTWTDIQINQTYRQSLVEGVAVLVNDKNSQSEVLV
jgi:hypothetical protein